ncbi:hypothetical protein BC833DRAFT_613184 [Globomyces pollinis-pini]|nr:hypothetical protein BC833DRAFT_613184 [Globomyces pollinis-pini]
MDFLVSSNDSDLIMKHSINIPSEAMGRIIGKGRANINHLKSLDGIIQIKITQSGLNHNVCEITATSEDAISKVLKLIEAKLTVSRTQLDNSARRIHSYLPTPSGRILTPDQVHVDARKAKKGSKQWERQQERIKGVKESLEHERRKNTY